MKTASTSVGFKDALSVLVANGNLILDLSQAAEVTSNGGLVVPTRVVLPLNASAKIASTQIFFNDELSPSGTTYHAVLLNSGGSRVADFGNWSLSGASIDLSTMVPSNASVSYSGAVLLSPTGNQTITNDLLPAVTGTQNLGSVSKLWNAFLNTLSAVTATITNLTVTTVNKLTLTAPATGATLTLINGTTVTGPSTSGTLALGVPNKQVFTSSGTFTIPAGVAGVKVTLVGGGGAGGGATAANNGGGGGSGGYAEKLLSGLTAGNTIAVTVGTGGAGSAGANGAAGIASSIASGTQTISTVTANGGSGGQTQAGNVATPGNGAAVSTGGDINGFGVNGFFTATAQIGGAGGSTFLGGGGLGGANSIGGAAGTNSGSGGGGAGGPGSSLAGGAGAAGMVIFIWIN